MKLTVLYACGVFLLVTGLSEAGDPAGEGSTALSVNTQRIDQVVGMIASTNDSVRMRAVSVVLNERKELVKRLCVIAGAKSGKYSDESRSAAAYVLGIMRAPEAAEPLARAVAYPLFLGRDLLDDSMDPFRNGGAVIGALVEIGFPSAPAAIRVIRTSDDEYIARHLPLILGTVLHRKAWTLDALKSLIEEEKNADAKRRLEAARDYLLSTKGDDTSLVVEQLRDRRK